MTCYTDTLGIEFLFTLKNSLSSSSNRTHVLSGLVMRRALNPYFISIISSFHTPSPFKYDVRAFRRDFFPPENEPQAKPGPALLSLLVLVACVTLLHT